MDIKDDLGSFSEAIFPAGTWVYKATIVSPEISCVNVFP